MIIDLLNSQIRLNDSIRLYSSEYDCNEFLRKFHSKITATPEKRASHLIGYQDSKRLTTWKYISKLQYDFLVLCKSESLKFEKALKKSGVLDQAEETEFKAILNLLINKTFLRILQCFLGWRWKWKAGGL